MGTIKYMLSAPLINHKTTVINYNICLISNKNVLGILVQYKIYVFVKRFATSLFILNDSFI